MRTEIQRLIDRLERDFEVFQAENQLYTFDRRAQILREIEARIDAVLWTRAQSLTEADRGKVLDLQARIESRYPAGNPAKASRKNRLKVVCA